MHRMLKVNGILTKRAIFLYLLETYKVNVNALCTHRPTYNNDVFITTDECQMINELDQT